MKCPTCGAWSEVRETRKDGEFMTRRTRRCANGHRFSSYELSATVVRRLGLARVKLEAERQVRGVVRRQRTCRIRETVARMTAEGASLDAVAKALGVSVDHARRVRKQQRG